MGLPEQLSTERRYLTTVDVAAMTRSTEATVRFWRYNGTGPKGFRLGRRVLYREEDVLRWLDERSANDGGTAA